MKTKLTLSVDKDIVQFAQQQAATSNTSISGMFSEFILSCRAEQSKSNVPSVTSMTGSLKNYVIDDSKQAIRTAYANKYLH